MPSALPYQLIILVHRDVAHIDVIIERDEFNTIRPLLLTVVEKPSVYVVSHKQIFKSFFTVNLTLLRCKNHFLNSGNIVEHFSKPHHDDSAVTFAAKVK